MMRHSSGYFRDGFVVSDDEEEDEFQHHPPAKRRRLAQQLEKYRKEIQQDIPTIEKILEAPMPSDSRKRCIRLLDVLKNTSPCSVEELEMEERIQSEMQKYSSSSQSTLDRELQELKEISKEDPMLNKVLNVVGSTEVRSIIFSKYQEFSSMNLEDSNYTTYREWLDWATSLPHTSTPFPLPTAIHDNRQRIKNSQELKRYLTSAREIFDRKIYGQPHIKETLLSFLANKMIQPHTGSLCLGLCGDPGTGKTAIVEALAEATGLPYTHLSLGSQTDELFFGGANKTYVGSSPGFILRCLRRFGSHMIISMDELDKLEPRAQFQLLTMLDPQTNTIYRDMFLPEFTFDISGILFVATMNTTTTLSPALYDRVPIFTMESYGDEDRITIIYKYMFEELKQRLGLDGIVLIPKRVILRFYQVHSQESLRYFKHVLGLLLSRINLKRVMGDIKPPITVDNKMIENLIR